MGSELDSPPGNLESQRRCLNDKNTYGQKITDKTCCIHAEERAIFDALRRNAENIKESALYFIRLNLQNNKIFFRRALLYYLQQESLDVGIKEFILWHESGICIYNADEYNSLSFGYKKI